VPHEDKEAKILVEDPENPKIVKQKPTSKIVTSDGRVMLNRLPQNADGIQLRNVND